MKSNEVRVGNFILFSGVKTKVIPQDFATQCRGVNSSEMPNFNPIELTEEWLLKAGFEKIENGKYLNSFYVTIINNYCVFWITDTYSITIKYVHELQNLYFALTGEDLVFSTEP